jgi:hypothetical protein
MQRFLGLSWFAVMMVAAQTEVGLAQAQYKVEKVSAAPEGVAAGFTALLQKEGSRVSGADGKAAFEIWFRAEAPKSASPSNEDAVSLPTVPHGAFLGVVHFSQPWADRRGQTIKAGIYTLRYSMFPVNGDHQGVAPQRDFLLLTPVAGDADPAGLPTFDQLVEMSRKASGTPHPAVLSCWKADPLKPGFAPEGEHDWVLQGTVGDLPVAIILIGKAEG